MLTYHKPKIAIVCDWLISRGGAERVIQVLAEMFPDAPIYTTLYNKQKLPEFAKRTVITSFLQKMPFALKKHYMYLPLMPYAVEQFDLSEFDIVISSSHSCAKGVITKPKTLHICYCHSPMRYAWDSCHEYFAQYGIPKALHGRAKKILHELRIWDRLSAERVDAYLANSEHVKKRIWKYYRKDARVLYPPVDTKQFTSNSRKSGHGQFFLAVGRLAPYKRFDLLVETFNELKMPLVIVGTGKEEQKLKRMAGRFITFTGLISDEELAAMYHKATALIFPQVEDFGITPLEAMSAGIPVIAYREGGALETVIPGKTGVFFSEQTVSSLKKAVLELESISWDADAIREHANHFNRESFEKTFRAFLGEKWEKWQKEMR